MLPLSEQNRQPSEEGCQHDSYVGAWTKAWLRLYTCLHQCYYRVCGETCFLLSPAHTPVKVCAWTHAMQWNEIADQPHALALPAKIPNGQSGRGDERTSMSCGRLPVWLTEAGGGCVSGSVLGSALSTTATDPELIALVPGPPSRGLAGMNPGAPARAHPAVSAERGCCIVPRS